MEDEVQTISPLRRRMLEDMRIRSISIKSQTAYVRAVRKLAAYLGRSPDTATAEDLRRFQLHMADSGVSPQTINVTLTGLRFFFHHTVHQPRRMCKTSYVKVPRRIPVVLSVAEAKRLLQHAGSPMYRGAVGGLWSGSACQRGRAFARR